MKVFGGANLIKMDGIFEKGKKLTGFFKVYLRRVQPEKTIQWDVIKCNTNFDV